jgi:hypothetical protein
MCRMAAALAMAAPPAFDWYEESGQPARPEEETAPPATEEDPPVSSSTPLVSREEPDSGADPATGRAGSRPGGVPPERCKDAADRRDAAALK